jgi:acetyl esterase
MSTVVTRIIKAPSVSLTSRAVPPYEVIHIPTRHGAVRCLITRPAPDAPLAIRTSRPPVTINIHGGGFVIGNPLQDDHLVRGIAGEVGSVVVNVDYSTSPRVRFPRALEECFDVLLWVSRSGEDMGWDESRIALTGGSAGANLALGLLTLVGRHGGPAVRTAALIVPAVDLAIPPELHISPLAKPFINAGMRRMVDEAYFEKNANKLDPLASPGLLGEELAAFPPLLIVTAEFDTFRPSIDHFVERARSHGVTVDSQLIEKVDHDFYFVRTTSQPVLTTLMALMRDSLLKYLAP